MLESALVSGTCRRPSDRSFHEMSQNFALPCRPTTSSNARQLGTLTPPPGKAICPHSLCYLHGPGSSSALAALCRPAATKAQAAQSSEPCSMACWRLPHSIATRSSAQLRSSPLILNPCLSLSLSELQLSQQPHLEGANESAEPSANGCGVAQIASMPGVHMPAFVLGGSTGICALVLPKLLAPSSDSSHTSEKAVLRGLCPQAAGQASTCTSHSACSIRSACA